MHATAPTLPIRSGKRRLLESCAITAGLMALALGGPALAQVNGVHIPTPGVTVETNPGGNATNVSVTAPESIINWIPDDAAPTGGAIDFLPAGESWNFSGSGDYTVLNRFVNSGGGSLSREIALNGTVNSIDTSTSSGRGGSIWFYNAGGVLIGSSGVINVGSLVLTANDIDTTGGLFGPGGTIRFRGATSTAAITVNGNINADNPFNPGSSYVALVAPRVVQAGAVRVDGSAAYVAAEQVDIRIGNVGGLFDINVTVGAEGGNAITHTGSTTGPAHQQGDGDKNRIYMVAIPKNDAVTMLVSGTIGYDDASSAQVDPDGAVRLSAGYNITNGEQNLNPANATAANITVNDTLFRSSTSAHASGTFTGVALQQIPASPPPLSSAGRIFVEGDGVFSGNAGASLTIGAGQQGGATGNLIIRSDGAAGAAGNVAVNVSGGTLSTGNLLQITSLGLPATATGDSVGGTASLTITGGTVTSPVISVSANASADIGTNGQAGNATGGNASISVSNSGTVLDTGTVFINANASGPTNISVPTGGDAQGGTATLTVANGASFRATNNVSIDANGSGGFGPVQSGNGTGGTARIEISGANTSFESADASLKALGNGAGSSGPVDARNGGDGTGGRAELLVNADNSATILLDALSLDASGQGGDASNSENATGGDAQGGVATATVNGGVTLQTSQLTLDAKAQGGNGLSPSGTTGQSGNSRGGTVTLTATNGSTVNSGSNISLFAVGMGVGGENFGTGTGGDVTVTAATGGTISAANQMVVDARGGSEGSAMAQSAGNGTGGNVDFIANGGTISAETYNVDVRGQIVNVRGNNGAAQGGTIDLNASNGGQIRSTLDATNIFNASAEAGISAGGSSATGGTIRLIADGGGIDLSGTTNLIAGGVTGGASGPAAGNVTGAGGTILVQLLPNTATASTVTFGSLGVDANGRTLPTVDAPGGALNGIGNGQGGTLTFDIQGGTLSSGVVNLTANGTGARGNGQGGTATFTQTGGTINVSDLTISADGFGGVAPGQSGNGTGGTATVNLLGGTLNAAEIIATADGEGGAGNNGTDSDPLNPVLAGRGGNGQGGTATIRIDGTTVDSGTMQANARGTGGAGGTFFTSSGSTSPGVPGNGGNGTGGNATVNIVSGTVTGSDITANASGAGGVGGDSSTSSGTSTGTGVGGTGGNGQGGTATIRLATAVTASGTLSSVARGVGGHGDGHDSGGNGGNGIGGLAQAIIDNFDAGTLAVTIDASARGGDGANGRNGSGGNGGNATGGTARALADGANARVTVAQTNFITVGTGGNGGNGARSFLSAPGVRPAGGVGGNGQGGTLEVRADNGAAVALIPITSGAISLSSTGIGGNGGDGADYNVSGQTGGDGGNAGAGRGGSVALHANGGTITSNGNDIDIQVSGFSGAGGLGGDGAAGTGAAGSTATTTGGLAVIEALAGPGGPGQISLGATNIAASGDNAGRILLRSGGNITMASLTATANGAAPPTNNDTDTAPAGIFLAATGGTIATTANMSLTTDSSIGVYAQGAGTVSAGTGLSMNAADQIDIRHDQRSGTAPTIQAVDELTAIAGTSISAAPGSLIGSGSTLLLAANGPNGTIGVDRLDAANISVNSSGAARVDHAETSGNFTVQAASFRTGPNSIITGGDIDITSPGAVDLGNSTAGGFVQVTGQSIAFNSIGAGSTVGLNATGAAAGAEGISGGSITAGGNINLNGNSIAITGPVQGTGSLFAFTSGGNLGIALADVDGNIGINASGNLTGSYAAGGNVTLTAGGDIVAQANAAGGYVDPNSNIAEGTVFADADGNATLTNSSAATMLGVRAGQAASVSNTTAGEDVLVLAGTTATLANVTAGDDLTVTAAGGITANGITTTGAGPDNRTLFYGPAGSPGFNSFQITTSAASGTVTTTGLLQSGLATNISGSALSIEAITAGTDIGLNATAGGVTSTGTFAAANDLTINATGNAQLTGLDAGDDIRINVGGTLAAAAAYSRGTGADNESDGSNIVIAAGATSIDHSEAANNFVANVASFQTGLNSIITGGDINITSAGAADLGNSTAGGSITVDAQSIAFNALDAGTTIDLSASGTAPGAEGIDGATIIAGGDINLNGNSIAITGAVTGGASFFATGSGGAVAVNQANIDGNISISATGDLTGTYVSGGNIFLNSSANITASASANGGYLDSSGATAEGNLFVDAAGNATLTNSAAARMFGVNAGQAVTITGGTAGEDLLVQAGSTANLSGFTAGDDVTIRAAGAITAQNVSTTGQGADTHALSYLPGSGFTINTAGADGADIIMASTNGAINAGGLSAGDDILLTAATTLAVNGATTLGLGTTGGDSSIRTQGGDTTLGNLNAFDDIVATSTGAVAVTAPATARRDISITAASVNVANLANSGGVVDGLDAGRNLQVTTSGAITGGAMRAGGNLALTAGTTIAIARAATGAGGSLALDGAGGVNAGIVAGGGATSLNSSGGAVSVNSLASTGAVNANGQSILIAGGSGNLVFSQINASAGDAVITNSGDISVTSGLATGRAALTSANGAVNVTQLSANSIDLAAGTDMTLGTVTAAQGLTVQAGNMLTLAGVITGRDMALTSGDIAIGANGRAGTAGTTQTLGLANGNSGRPTFVGGTGTRSGYHIDAAEMTRLYGNAIRISGPAVANSAGAPAGGPDLVIDSFTMTGGGSGSNLGANGSLTIATAGSARVIGNALLTGLTDANTLNLTAADRLEVIMGQGSVRLTGANNAPGGQLNLMADDVIVATLAAIADIGAATTTDAIETRLAQNDGVTSDEGALFARGINADVDGGFYVQNSGTGTAFAERRGLTFGAGGLNVVTDGPSRIVINGVHLGPAGQVTGLDAVALLTVGGAPVSGPSNRFDPRSRFNGCLIAASGACTFLARGIESSFPVQDVIDNQADPDTEESEANSLPTPLITMRDIDALTGEPLLDDPVTGAGNDDLWTPPTE